MAISISTNFLTDIWYIACSGAAIAKGKTIRKEIAGKAYLIGRKSSGELFSLIDACPHRAVPLSDGDFDGEILTCCYHGWQFNSAGRCTKIPSLGPDEIFKTEKIGVKTFPVVEKNGLVWIFARAKTTISSATAKSNDAPSILDDSFSFKHVSSHHLNATMDNAVLGLIDPAHVPNVHRSWWWKSGKKLKKKEKHFSPISNGFRMSAHSPTETSRIYSLLKKKTKVEIDFILPGVRIEKIQHGKSKKITLLTALIPTGEQTTELQQYISTNVTIVKLLYPMLALFGRAFIKQDEIILRKQQKGMVFNPPTMLLGEADQQAKWYLKLKEHYNTSLAEEKEMEHPLKEHTSLTWWT